MATIGARGGEKMQAILAKLANQAGKNTTVRVGFQDGATYPTVSGNPVYLAQAAFWAEYGTQTAPARPFFRTMIANKSKEWPGIIRKLMERKTPPAQIMAIVGERIVDELKYSALHGGWEKNADSTIAAKGFDKPLVDTSQMIGTGITYEVIEE